MLLCAPWGWLPGGNLSMGFLAHQAAVYKMAALPGMPLNNLWKDDITVESMPIVAGSVQVPEGPGLGVTLDRRKYEQYAATSRPYPGRFLSASAIGTVLLPTFGPTRSFRPSALVRQTCPDRCPDMAMPS